MNKAYPFFIHTTQKHDEGIYHVRLYSVPTDIAVRLDDHYWWRVDATSVGTALELDPERLDPLDAFQVSAGAELAQGIPSINTLKLSFAPDDLLMHVVRAARDTNTDIWCEVTLEQMATGVPTRPKNRKASIVWPIKERSMFWGKLDRPSLHGSVDVQRWQGETVVQDGRRHLGALTMEFVHWLKIRGEG